MLVSHRLKFKDIPKEACMHNNYTKSLSPLFLGLISLFFSGVASLIAQVVIQKYVSVVAGGVDAIIMNTTAFTFIAGLSCGGLVGGLFTRHSPHSIMGWFTADFFAGVGCLVFIALFHFLHDSTFSMLFAKSWFNSLNWYYAYIIFLDFTTTFVLAFIMGLNFPFSFDTLTKASSLSPAIIGILVLFFNTAGAALGSFLSSALMTNHDLVTLIHYATIAYALSACLVLFIKQQNAKMATSTDQTSHSSISLSKACTLIFLSGLAGFSVELFLLRINTVKFPVDHALYGNIVAKYLVFWSLGCMIAIFNKASLKTIFRLFILSLISLNLFIIFYSRNLSDWLLLMPALFSGWLYGQVYNQIENISAWRATIVTFANISGCFVGSLLTGYLFPTFLSVTYVFIALLVLFIMMDFYLNSQRKRPLFLLYTCTSIATLFAVSFIHLPTRFFSNLYQIADKSAPFDFIENWSGVAALFGNTFYIGGIGQTGDADNPFGGIRDIQAFLPSIIKKRDHIGYIGVAFGVSNGFLAKLNPQSTVDDFDYTKTLPLFWKRYSDMNFDLIHQKNSFIHLEDGRLGMKLTHQKFDVVVEVTSGDGVPGISAIKSKEFFELLKCKMTPDGVFITMVRSKVVANTLQKVFKHVYKLRGETVVIACDTDLEKLIDHHRMKQLLAQYPKMQAALEHHAFFPHEGSHVNYNAIDYFAVPDDVSARYVQDTDPVADYYEIMQPIKEA